VGQTEYSAWAIPTSEGIIVIDALYDYSVEPQIADGLRKLGYDPSDIKFVIVSHLAQAASGDYRGGRA
jgi:metallo-beta-lactamase class B